MFPILRKITDLQKSFTTVIVLDLEINDIFEKFGYYIDPTYLGYRIPKVDWALIVTEFKTRGLDTKNALLYQSMTSLLKDDFVNLYLDMRGTYGS